MHEDARARKSRMHAWTTGAAPVLEPLISWKLWEARSQLYRRRFWKKASYLFFSFLLIFLISSFFYFFLFFSPFSPLSPFSKFSQFSPFLPRKSAFLTADSDSTQNFRIGTWFRGLGMGTVLRNVDLKFLTHFFKNLGFRVYAENPILVDRVYFFQI